MVVIAYPHFTVEHFQSGDSTMPWRRFGGGQQLGLSHYWLQILITRAIAFSFEARDFMLADPISGRHLRSAAEPTPSCLSFSLG